MPETIILVSSSPPRPPSRRHNSSPPKKRPCSSSIGRDTIAGASRIRRSPSSSPPAEDPFLSDDDFSLAEFRKITKSNHGPAPKKQRLAVKEPNVSMTKSSSTNFAPSNSAWHQHGFKSDLNISNDNSFQFDLTSDNIELPTCKSNKENTALRNDDIIMSSALKDKGKRPETSAARRILDDIDPFASSSPAVRKQMTKSQSKTAAWDPISSSAPLPAGSDVIPIDDSDSEDDFPDTNGLTAARLNSKPTVPRASTGSPAKAKGKSKATTSKPKSTEPKKTTEEKAREKEEKAAAREAEKERKRLENERAKEQRIIDKQRATARAEVNKLRTDKKVTTPEMIVELPAGLRPAIKYGAEELLGDLKLEVNTIPSPVVNVVRWRRKVDSEFDPVLNRYEPVPPRKEREKYTMVILEAQEFVNTVLEKTLTAHVQKMKTHFPEATSGYLIYLIEGLEPYLRKTRSARNRQFQTAVRNNLDSSSVSLPSSDTYISEDLVEGALLELQLMHSVLIHHTNTAAETSRQISVFTEHISTAPYRRQKEQTNDENAGFCMDTGQVKTGEDNKDTYIKMLQEISHVTKSVAYGIANEFETVSKLVKGFEVGGDQVLQGVRKSANKDGTFSDRLVGGILSKRVGRVFTGRDWEEEDV